MKKILILIIIVLIRHVTIAQEFQWVEQLTGLSEEIITGVAVDKDKSVIICGYFGNTIEFDGTTYTSLENRDMFVAKYDINGNPIWFKHFPGDGDQETNDIDIDSQGNIYFSGIHNLEMDLGGGVVLPENISFLIKLNQDGSPLWAFTEKVGEYALKINAMAINNNDEVVLGGLIDGFATLSPTHQISSASGKDAFLVKVDANKNVVWANVYEGIGSTFAQEQVNNIVTDLDNNIYFTGDMFNGSPATSLTIGSFNLTGKFDSDAFIAKLNSEGVPQWASMIHDNAGSYPGASPNEKIYDLSFWNNSIYLTGNFDVQVQLGATLYETPANFDPMLGIETRGTHGFLSKIDAVNGAFIWSKILESDFFVEPSSLLANEIFISVGGRYRDNLSVDTKTNDASDPFGELFLINFNPDGKVINAEFLKTTSSGGSSGTISAISHIENNSIAASCYFSIPSTFGSFNLTTGSSLEGGVFRYNVAVSGNNPPTVVNPIPDQTVEAGSSLQYTFPAITFTDPDGDALNYTTGSLPGFADFTAFDRTFFFNPGEADAGQYNIEVIATDPDGAQISDVFQLTVIAPANNPPTVANPIPDQTVEAGGSLQYTFPANTFTDPDGDALNYTTGSLPGFADFTAFDRTFFFNPGEAEVGQYNIEVIATDPDGAQVSDVFQLTITAPANNAPTVANPIPDQTVETGSSLQYTFPANSFTDPDGDALNYTTGSLPGFADFTAFDRTFFFDPGEAEVGQYNIEVIATDPDGAQVSDVFHLTVIAPANNPPIVVNPIPDQTVEAGSSLQYTFPANTFTEPDGDALNYTTGSLPGFADFTAFDRTFFFDPGEAEVGQYNIEVIATDPDGAQVSDVFQLTVIAPANNPPTVVNPIPDQMFAAGGNISYTIPANTFSDPDGDQLVFRVTNLPGFLSYDQSLETISGTPGDQDVGSYTIEIIATDPQGATASTSLQLIIEPQQLSVSIQTNDLSVCFDGSGSYQAMINKNINVNYEWYVDGELVGQSRQLNLNNLTEDVQLEVKVFSGSEDAFSDILVISVNPLPQTTLQNEAFFLHASPGTSYRWYRDGELIEASGQTIIANELGIYQVEVINEFGCSAMSDAITVIITGDDSLMKNAVSIYPNPAKGQFQLRTNGLQLHEVNIIDLKGVKSKLSLHQAPMFDIADYAPGIYVIDINTQFNHFQIKIIKQ